MSFPFTDMDEPTIFCQQKIENLVGNVRPATIPEYILKCANKQAKRGKKYFIIDVVTGRHHSYAEFGDLTKRVGSALYKRGMRKGDTLIYMPYDVVHIHVIFMGVWRANGIVRASYPEDDEETLVDRIEECRAGWILCEPETSKMCLAAASRIYWTVEVIVIGEAEGCTSIYDLFADDGKELPDFKLTEDSIAMILCTSGTTGKSKGAVHTHRSLLHQILSVPYFIPFTKNKPNLLASKGTHISGSVFPIGCLTTGNTCLVMAKTTKENIFKAVEKFKPGLVFGFPTFLLQLVNDPDAHKYDFSSIIYASSGGAPITPAIETTLMKLPNIKAVLIIYGLTEICPITSGNQHGLSKPGKYKDTPSFSIGKVSPGIDLQIRDPETHKILGPNQNGEICVKGESLFHSYYKNPEATKNSFVDGWFLTGDIGYYDDNFFLFIVDRFKEIFKYYNNHISPTELEDVIASHPDVDEVCVVGVVDPDGGDRIPRAFVTVKPSDTCSTAKEICQYANGKMADYKQLRGGLYILPELPKGKTGKISRQLMLQLTPEK